MGRCRLAGFWFLLGGRLSFQEVAEAWLRGLGLRVHRVLFAGGEIGARGAIPTLRALRDPLTSFVLNPETVIQTLTVQGVFPLGNGHARNRGFAAGFGRAFVIPVSGRPYGRAHDGAPVGGRRGRRGHTQGFGHARVLPKRRQRANRCVMPLGRGSG